MEQNTAPSLFQIKPANEWLEEANKRPIPKMLFGEFWFESELCILFADTNLGKSILAVQIANSISSGYPTCGLQLEAEQQPVIYLDFELSDKQFECRYSENYKNHFNFNPNFFRAEIETATKIPSTFESFEAYLCESIKNTVLSRSAKVLIIDNISYLKNGTEKASEATTLMIFLNELKKAHNLSILVLAHTPKRDYSKPLSKNDLSGSKSLMNFCDSSFAIGQSFNATGVRYLKQIKQRVVEEIYGTENVITCSIVKDVNYLHFKFNDYDNELNHLKVSSINDTDTRNEEILSLKKEGHTNVAIAEMLKVSEGTVRNVLKKQNS
ncbi:AAA family ATPase [Pseudotamlana haliotis]|uniref:AAA family ATPase n=1 Tax=Pseudotamlana haliotis TaxID=2614804 RepID=UPI001CD9B691|nr:AAA family ATPase [Tamlana haliotis]